MRFDYPTLEQTSDLRRLWQQAFGDSEEFLDDFFGKGFSPRRCRCATENGMLAGALYWFDCEVDGEKLAYIYGVATDGAFRRRGICRRLMEDTHALLKGQDYVGTILVPGATSLARVYAPLGYRYCTQIREFFCTADPEPVALRPIDVREYTRLRRQLLPEGAVLQEGDTLPFLASQTSFYAGQHLLLAARKEDASLFGLELLGDATAAPGVLSALGAAQGRFRTPGEGRPFAMFCPFEDVAVPKYLAFAFD